MSETQLHPPISLPVNPNDILEIDRLKSGEIIIRVENGKVRKIVEDWIKAGLDIHLSTIVGIDENDRIDVMYYFMNRKSYDTIAIVTGLDRENPKTDSIDDLVSSAFYEGEVREMLGVIFEGNEISRVFLPEKWDSGYPLRKDWKPKEEKENE